MCELRPAMKAHRTC